MKQRLRYAAVVGGDTELLPYALEHYRQLGVQEFYIVRHVENGADPRLAESVEVMRTAGLAFVDIHEGAWHEDLNARLLRRVMDTHSDGWWVVADLDEFHVYDRPLAEVVELCERDGYDYVEGAFLDRVAFDGSFPALVQVGDRPLIEQYPLAGLVTYRILGGRPTKVTLCRGWVRLDLGQHCALNGRRMPAETTYAQVHHFKWTGSVVDRLIRRIEQYESGRWRLMHPSITGESKALLEHIRQHRGRIDVGDPTLALRPCGLHFEDYPQWADEAGKIHAHYSAHDRLRLQRHHNAHP